jgi:hypothetical protein
MTFSAKQIVTTAVWGWAFKAVSETVVVCVNGACAGKRLGRGQSIDGLPEAMAAWNRVLPPIAAIAGLCLGLTGLLPGTEKR